jgi:hypothetical protein
MKKQCHGIIEHSTFPPNLDKQQAVTLDQTVIASMAATAVHAKFSVFINTRPSETRVG